MGASSFAGVAATLKLTSATGTAAGGSGAAECVRVATHRPVPASAIAMMPP
jgi:hypothetical protein